VKLRLSVSPKVLRLAILAKRLAVAVGQFIKIKRLENSVGVASDPIVIPNKILNNSASVFEASSIEPKKNIFDGVGFDDGTPYFLEDYVVGAPDFQDYTLGVQVIKVFTKSPVLTNVTALSAPALTFQKSFSDQFFATDDVDGLLTDQDDLTLEFFKATDHTPVVSEIRVFNFSKEITDQPNYFLEDYVAEDYVIGPRVFAEDAGTLLSQGYVLDATYFAEDYVGESRTFS
jgi:hypothetical protein